MNKKSIILLLSTSLLLISCGAKGPSEPTIKNEVKVEARIYPDSGTYNLKFEYKDSSFTKSSEKYDPVLAFASLGATLSASYNAAEAEKYFGGLSYLDVQTFGYDSEESNNCAFVLAHKTIDENDVVALSFRGADYKQEWANNFLVGEEGDHAGFTLCAEKVLLLLESYINAKSIPQGYKLWLSGYSRGAALANVLSSKLLKDELIAEENLYAYTFATPRGLTLDNAVAYKCVHNIISSADIVTYVAPAQYDLYRCGTDVDLYSENMPTLLSEFDENIVVPNFTSVDGKFTTEAEFANYLINFVTSFEADPEAEEDQTQYLFNTRAQYHTNLESRLSYILDLVFGLSDSTVEQFKADLEEKGGYMYLLSLLQEDQETDPKGTKLFNFVTHYLDMDNTEYDRDELFSVCAYVYGLVRFIMNPVIQLIMGMGFDNFTRLIDHHYPETYYVLLQEYNKNIKK